MNDVKKLRIHLDVDVYEDDLKYLAKRCGIGGITVKELLENFIGDLTYSDHTRNGSDECDYANQWYDRCWFGWNEDKTFLRYLLDSDQTDDFADIYEEWVYVKQSKDTEDIEREKECRTELEELYQEYVEDVKYFKNVTPETFEKALEHASTWTREWTDFREECEVLKDVAESSSTDSPE